MNTIVQFIPNYGYSILFAALFAHQVGLPLPGPLFLLAAGALAAAGKLDMVLALGLAITACVLADWAWYEAGRKRGDKVLHLFHQFARDPDAHHQRAKEIFARYGVPLLVLAKFVPGLDAIAPPLAGTSRISRLRFLAFDAVGAGLYSGAYAGLGYVFSHDLDRAAAYATGTGTFLAAAALTALFIYAGCKLFRSHRLIGDSRVARNTPANPAGRERPADYLFGIVEGLDHDH
jgi:membrane protein DedA with SNARE-associated domain